MQDHALEQLVGKSKFTEASDSLVLEDVSVRMQLKGALLNVGELVTGVVAAFKGTAAPGGDFWVSVSSSWGATLAQLAERQPSFLKERLEDGAVTTCLRRTFSLQAWARKPRCHQQMGRTATSHL